MLIFQSLLGFILVSLDVWVIANAEPFDQINNNRRCCEFRVTPILPPESSLHLTAVAIPTATLRISTARDSASDSETDSASNAVEDETDAALVLVQLLRPQTSPNAQPCRLFTRPTTRSPSEAPAGRSANMERAKIETTMQDEDEERSAEENLLPFTLRLMPLRGIYTQLNVSCPATTADVTSGWSNTALNESLLSCARRRVDGLDVASSMLRDLQRNTSSPLVRLSRDELALGSLLNAGFRASAPSGSLSVIVHILIGGRVHRSKLHFDEHAESALLSLGPYLESGDEIAAGQPGGLALVVDVYASEDDCPPPPIPPIPSAANTPMLAGASGSDTGAGVLVARLNLHYLRDALSVARHAAVDEELLVVAGERSVFFHEVNNGTYAQVAYHSLPPDSQILGMSAGANGSVLLCVVNASASRSVGSSTASLVKLSLRTSSRTNTNASETDVQSVALLRSGAELPSECGAQCSLASDTLQSADEGERVYVLCGKKVVRCDGASCTSLFDLSKPLNGMARVDPIRGLLWYSADDGVRRVEMGGDEVQYEYTIEYEEGDSAREKAAAWSETLEHPEVHAFDLNLTSGRLVLPPEIPDSNTLAVVMRNNGYGYFRLDSEADVGTVQSIESVKGTRKQATIKLHAEPLRALVVTGRLRDPHPIPNGPPERVGVVFRARSALLRWSPVKPYSELPLGRAPFDEWEYEIRVRCDDISCVERRWRYERGVRCESAAGSQSQSQERGRCVHLVGGLSPEHSYLVAIRTLPFRVAMANTEDTSRGLIERREGGAAQWSAQVRGFTKRFSATNPMWLTIVRLDSESLQSSGRSANADASSPLTTQPSLLVDQVVLQESRREPQLFSSQRLHLSPLQTEGAAVPSRLSRALSRSPVARDEFLRRNIFDVQSVRGHLLLLTRAGALYAVRLFAVEKQVSSSPDATQVTRMADSASAFAVDLLTATVYYISNGKIVRRRLSSGPNSPSETLARLSSSASVGPRGIALSSEAGVLCWAFTFTASTASASYENEYTIECARLDGSARVTATKGRLRSRAIADAEEGTSLSSATRIGLAIDRSSDALLQLTYWFPESADAITREAPVDKPVHLVAIRLETNHSISVVGETGNLVLKRFEEGQSIRAAFGALYWNAGVSVYTQSASPAANDTSRLYETNTPILAFDLNPLHSLANRRGVVPLALEEKDLLVCELTNPSRVRITISNTSALLKSTRVPLFYDIEWKFDNVKSTEYLQNMTRWSNSIFEITAPLPFEMLHLLLTPFTMWARGDTLNVSLVVPNAERLRVSRLRVLNIGDLNERMAVFDVSLTSRSLLSRARVRTFCGKQSILVQEIAFEEAIAHSPFARVLSSLSTTTPSKVRNVALEVPMNNSCEDSTRCFAIQLCYENICGDRSEAYCDKGESTGSRPLLLTALQANSTPPRLAIIARSFANATAPGATYSHVLLPLPLVSAAVKSYCFVGRRMFFTDGRALYTSALEWREQLALRHSFPIYSPYSSSGRTAGGASSIERVACDPEHSSSRVFLLERSAGSLRVAAVSVDPLTVNAARLRATGADNEPIEIARQQLDPTRTLAVGSLLYSPRHRILMWTTREVDTGSSGDTYLRHVPVADIFSRAARIPGNSWQPSLVQVHSLRAAECELESSTETPPTFGLGFCVEHRPPERQTVTRGSSSGELLLDASEGQSVESLSSAGGSGGGSGSGSLTLLMALTSGLSLRVRPVERTCNFTELQRTPRELASCVVDSDPTGSAKGSGLAVALMARERSTSVLHELTPRLNSVDTLPSGLSELSALPPDSLSSTVTAGEKIAVRSTSTSTSAAALTHSVALTLLSTTSASIRVRVQLAPSQSLPLSPSSHRLLLLLHAVARSGARDALRSCANTLVEHYLNAVPTGCFFQVVSIAHGSSEQVLTIERLQPFHKYVILAGVQLFASESNSSLVYSDFTLVLTNSSTPDKPPVFVAGASPTDIALEFYAPERAFGRLDDLLYLLQATAMPNRVDTASNGTLASVEANQTWLLKSFPGERPCGRESSGAPPCVFHFMALEADTEYRIRIAAINRVVDSARWTFEPTGCSVAQKPCRVRSVSTGSIEDRFQSGSTSELVYRTLAALPSPVLVTRNSTALRIEWSMPADAKQTPQRHALIIRSQDGLRLWPAVECGSHISSLQPSTPGATYCYENASPLSPATTYRIELRALYEPSIQYSQEWRAGDDSFASKRVPIHFSTSDATPDSPYRFSVEETKNSNGHPVARFKWYLFSSNPSIIEQYQCELRGRLEIRGTWHFTWWLKFWNVTGATREHEVEISEIDALLKTWAANQSADAFDDFNAPIGSTRAARDLNDERHLTSFRQKPPRVPREAATGNEVVTSDTLTSAQPKTTSTGSKQNASSEGASIRVGQWVVHFRLAALNAEGKSTFSYAVPPEASPFTLPALEAGGFVGTNWLWVICVLLVISLLSAILLLNRDVRFTIATKLHLSFVLTRSDRILLNPHQPLTCAGCRSRLTAVSPMAAGPSFRVSRESDGYGSGTGGSVFSSGGSRPASGSASGLENPSVPCVEFSGLGPCTTTAIATGGGLGVGMCQLCGGSANVAYSSAAGSQLISCDTSASAGAFGGRAARDTTGESLLLPVGEASALLGRTHRHSVHSVGACSLTRFGAIGTPGGHACELATIRFNPLADLNEENTIYESTLSGQREIVSEIHRLPRVNRNQIRLLKFLGSGAFGKVYKGSLLPPFPQGFTDKELMTIQSETNESKSNESKSNEQSKELHVAIKTLRRNATSQEQSEFLKEALLMMNFQHPNVIRLLAVCVEAMQGAGELSYPQFILLELMNQGDLLNYLRRARPTKAGPCSLRKMDLLGIIVDVARGCKYLEDLHFVHRDIATRNCLVHCTFEAPHERLREQRSLSISSTARSGTPAVSTSTSPPASASATGVRDDEVLTGGHLSTRSESKSGTAGDAEAVVSAAINASPSDLVSIVTSPEIAISDEKREQTEVEDKPQRSNVRITKIGDFGLARDIYRNDYYRKEGEGLLPVRWMSPEALIDGVFTTQSDVWSFGVLVWEVFTLGQQPYPARTNVDVLRYVRDGGRLDRPPNCPPVLFDIMKRCWESDASKRPQFAQIVEELETLFHRFQFSNLSPTTAPEAAPELIDELIFSERELLQFAGTAASVHIGANAPPQTRLPKGRDAEGEPDRALGAADAQGGSSSQESKSSPEAGSANHSKDISIFTSQPSPTNISERGIEQSAVSASSSSPSGGSLSASGSNSGLSSLTLTPERAQHPSNPEGYLSPRSPGSFAPHSLLVPIASAASVSVFSGAQSPLYRNVDPSPPQRQNASASRTRGLLVEEESGYLVPVRDASRAPSAQRGATSNSQRSPPQRIPRSPLQSDSSSVEGHSGRLNSASSVEPLLAQFSQPSHRSK